MKAPDEITMADLDCVVMPNGEVICLGRSLGWVDDFGEHLRPQNAEDATDSEQTEIKVFGVHDAMTYKPMMAFHVMPENDRERRILARAGFGPLPDSQVEYTFFYDVNQGECTSDPYKLTDQRTCGTAAQFIRGRLGFDKLERGGFLDCEYLRGEKDSPMTFEDEFDRY